MRSQNEVASIFFVEFLIHSFLKETIKGEVDFSEEGGLDGRRGIDACLRSIELVA